jgi:hypothetical protein
MTLSKGDKVRIKEDAPIDPVVLKPRAPVTAWNADSVEIDLRGQVGEVLSHDVWGDGWVCLMVTIAGCIKVRTYQRLGSVSMEGGS